MCPNDEEVHANVAAFLASPAPSGGGWLAAVGRFMVRILPNSLFRLLCRWMVGRMLASGSRVTCPMLTVSDLIRQHELKCVPSCLCSVV